MEPSTEKLFELPKADFQIVLDGLDTATLHSLGAASILANVTGEKLDQIILEDARRHKKHVEDGLLVRPLGPYRSLLEFAIRAQQPTPIIKHYIELYAEGYPEYIEFSHRSPLIDQVISNEMFLVLGDLISMGLAPPIARNGDAYMSKAIAHRSIETILWLIQNGQDFTSFLKPLDRRDMLRSGTPLYDYLKECHKDTLNGYVPKAERE
ncbi:hypothetical protein F4820DRAFT_446733 [Hypoxylon rubiginosum]|uniref:Uncharacterized protein n=1 Tax=Hypoxylon rubiginosum TaxID=110542 RepID=A0ACB9Z5G5_9PEZI|nr:hypothetical protein F4820DRAFT_446733 [Hypoxylon rubiginosum]